MECNLDLCNIHSTAVAKEVSGKKEGMVLLALRKLWFEEWLVKGVMVMYGNVRIM